MASPVSIPGQGYIPGAAAGSSLNVFKIVKDYVNRLIAKDKVMKVLLLDDDTLRIISVAYSQSELLERGVFLVDQLSNPQRKKMPTMRCIIFVRPANQTLSLVRDELKAARYNGYHLGFTNALPTETLDVLARADTHELVQQVEEYFADYVVVNADAITVPLRPNHLTAVTVQPDLFLRLAHGVTAACLSLRRKPLLRYQASSPYAKRLASEVAALIKSDAELYDFSGRDCVLLIVDRASDPVTPLLTPWTYQAMLHAHIGLEDNKLALPDTPPEEAYVFSQQDDPFFAANMFSNFGELCLNVKSYADQCKTAMNIDRSTATMEEIKTFMAKLPQTKALTGQVTKHVNVVTHLSAMMKARRLLDISMLEQDIVNSSKESEHLSRLRELMPTMNEEDRLRLCMLFNIRYERSASPSKMEEFLKGTPHAHMLQKLREYYGEGRSVEPLFGGKDVLSSLKSFVKGMKDVENIYTSHEPLLKKHLTLLGQGKLDSNEFPYLAPTSQSGTIPVGYKPKDVLVFMVGGMTYEEAALAHSINHNVALNGAATGGSGVSGDMRVLLGGTTVLNSRDFILGLDALV
jgi:vacuolar protein sorting-associated protein 45